MTEGRETNGTEETSGVVQKVLGDGRNSLLITIKQHRGEEKQVEFPVRSFEGPLEFEEATLTPIEVLPYEHALRDQTVRHRVTTSGKRRERKEYTLTVQTGTARGREYSAKTVNGF